MARLTTMGTLAPIIPSGDLGISGINYWAGSGIVTLYSAM
jgi:hypothetical protein